MNEGNKQWLFFQAVKLITPRVSNSFHVNIKYTQVTINIIVIKIIFCSFIIILFLIIIIVIVIVIVTKMKATVVNIVAMKLHGRKAGNVRGSPDVPPDYEGTETTNKGRSISC